MDASPPPPPPPPLSPLYILWRLPLAWSTSLSYDVQQLRKTTVQGKGRASYILMHVHMKKLPQICCISQVGGTKIGGKMKEGMGERQWPAISAAIRSDVAQNTSLLFLQQKRKETEKQLEFYSLVCSR